MTFLSALSLAVALLVAAPYLAHRLRRRRAEEQPFPPARLVEPALPKARRRSRLEDHGLLATRAAAVIALAVLGATPFVRCSRLSLQRSGGASVAVAIVIDDSMSMRVVAKGRSRFSRAREAALELLSSSRDGDAVALVLAGAPARVALAATTDLGAARDALRALTESDRSTDLDGAVALAGGLVASLPQVDRRVVVLSDLADGHPDAPPFGESQGVPIWVALPELGVAATDCGVMRADQSGRRVHVEVACGPGASAAGRDVLLEDAAGKVLARAPVGPWAGGKAELSLLVPGAEAVPARARLNGDDAIASDDVAPVATALGRGAVAVVADATEEAVVTGGAPILEQALAALRLDVELRPLPAFPEGADDLGTPIGVLLDDPPGWTPEQRHLLASFLAEGGVVLVALGPHAAGAPLGASLEPVLGHPVAWRDTSAPGADSATAVGELAGPAKSLDDLRAKRRAELAPEEVGVLESMVRWTDGAPLVARRAIGRGEAWIVTLPFSVTASDFPLRPAFLSLLDAWVRTAREHASPKRTDVGSIWKFPGAGSVEAEGPSGRLVSLRDEAGARLVPPLVGAYRVVIDGKTETRVAAPALQELDLRPRAAAPPAAGGGLGERRASVDASGHVALALLALMALELALRLKPRRAAF